MTVPSEEVSHTEAMTQIVCVGPNPSLDRTLVVSQLIPGSVHRASQVLVQAGGKAANVAKVLTALGGTPLLVGPIGGGAGAEIKRLGELTGLNCRWTEVAWPTRMCTAIVAVASGGSDGGFVTDVNEAGMVDEAGWADFLETMIKSTSAEDDTVKSRVLVSGSMPAVGKRDLVASLRDLMESIEDSATVWVDTSGPALAEVIDGERSVDLLKINLSEALEYLGQDWKELVLAESDRQPEEDLVLLEAGVIGPRAATELANRIDGYAVVTLGSGGAVLSDGQALWWGKVDAPQVLNPTGSGDSFFAGLAMGWQHGPVEALRLALACGASNAAHLPAGVIDPVSVADLTRKAVVVEGPRPE